MNVKQLKEELNKYPDSMDVFMAERTTDFDFGLVNSIGKRKVDFMEEPNGEILSSDECVVLNED